MVSRNTAEISSVVGALQVLVIFASFGWTYNNIHRSLWDGHRTSGVVLWYLAPAD